MRRNPRRVRRFASGMAVAAILLTGGGADAPEPVPPKRLFAQFDLPDAWKARFWSDPAARTLLLLDAKELADLVPVQAGVRFCRCPACDAAESDDPLSWSVARPTVLTCRRCGAAVGGATEPAK